jgi:hypothetical protein
MRNAYRIFVIIPEIKRLRGRPRGRWDNNFRTSFGEVRYKNVSWIHLA